MRRIVGIAVVHAGVLAGCNDTRSGAGCSGNGASQGNCGYVMEPSSASNGLRINQLVLQRQIHAVRGVKVLCRPHNADGSHWGCLVGDGMDPECHVVDVDEQGHWSFEDRPRSCHYP